MVNPGCSSLSFFSPAQVEEPAIEIMYRSPDRISFQVKGAGADITPMLIMGSVGIALGVAINEGIAKDVRDTAKATNVDFKTMFDRATSNMNALKDADCIEVKKYGFVIKDGSKDYVAAEVRLVMYNGDVAGGVLFNWPK